MISVLYEHVDTSIEDRFEFVSFIEWRLDTLPATAAAATGPMLVGPADAWAPYSWALRVSDMLRLLAAYRVESAEVFEEKRCSDGKRTGETRTTVNIE